MSAAEQAAELKQRGNEALQQGRPEEAVALFSMGIELEPSNEVFWSNRSAAYCKMRKYDRALADAEEVLRLKPEWARGHSRKAAALEGLQQADEALALYTQALRRDPDNQAVKSAIERLSMAKEQRREDRMLAADEEQQRAKQLHEEGNRAKKAGELERAAELYGEAIALQRDGATLAALHGNRAACYVLLKRPQDALEDASKSVELRPDWGRGHSRRGAALWALGRLREARAAYIEALVYDTTNGELQQQVQRIERELELSERREAEGDTPEVRAMACKQMGNDLLQKGDLDGALRAYSEGLEHHPTQYVLFSNRAAVLQRMGRLDEALADADRCVELAPEWVKGHTRKAGVIEALAAKECDPRRLKGAVRAYLKAVELDPDNAEWHDRAIALEQRVAEAEERAERQRRREGNCLGAVVAVQDTSRQQVVVAADPEEEGDRKFEAGDVPGAIGWYSKALKRNPGKRVLYIKRGICWDKVRRYVKALQDFGHVLEHFDKADVQALSHHGDCYIRLAGQVQDSDPDKAAEHFEHSVAAFQAGHKADPENVSRYGFEDKLQHARNEQAAFELTREDRRALLERARAKADRKARDGPGLDWKHMSEEEKRRRKEDMKRKREEAHFDPYLAKQAARGNLKEVGIAAAKKREKFHTSVAAKHTYTADGP